MYDNLETVCRDLDVLMINMFELMEEHIKYKMQMEEIMKSGCMELAKSRYIMGNNSVSHLQLPTEDSEDVTALKTVVSTIENKNKVECTTFRLDSSEKMQKSKKNEDGIRERTGKLNEKDLSAEMKNENGTINDPIKWFGLLVPQNLRMAQKGFKTLLELVVESANVQCELEATRKKMNKLRQLKKKFEKAAAT